MKNVVRFLGCVVVSIMIGVGSAGASDINNYCITPPFIQAPILPNLLLLIDNSASMYDLAYADIGRKSCSTTTSTYCTSDAGCPSGETCSNFLRQPYYCYDQTFSSAKTYAGYFDSSKLYKYDFTAREFVEESAAFSCTGGSGETAKSVSGQICAIYSSSNVVTVFKASGNYMNWLTASKFDVQKKILTGGKYDGVDLLSESRGCVGQSFVKEANTVNFVNYNSPETNNTNTALGITFGIRGPFDAVNASAPSPGGQTYIDIFKGNYDQGKCQAAMTAIVSGGNAEIKSTVNDCLASTVGTTAVTKTKVAFQQSMQACWQKREGHAIGGDDINTVKNQCTDIYTEYATCSNDPKKVCTTATVATDCGSGNSCIYGPPAIVPGNSALLCGNEYEGQYYYYQGVGTAGTCTYDGAACTTDANCFPASVKQCKKTDNYCTTDADCPGSGNSCFKIIANTCSTSAVAAGWKLIPGVTEAQMIATHNQYCSDMTVTPVIDPTDAPSDTSQYDNVPSILSGVGVEAQLSQPLGTLTVKLKKLSAPSGVISEFSDEVRIGAMTFNFAGSAAEATAGTLPAPKLCSNDATKVCTLNIDCVAPGTCNATTAGTNNLDGGKIIHYVGTGHCSTTTATVCYNDANCPSGEYCLSDGIGSYSSGLVKAVNDIKAQAWTPFAEAFYNAIGYFAKVPDTGLSRTDLRLNAGDFNENRNPSQYRCQSNNILLISDGMSTADRRSDVDNLAKLYTAAGGSTSWTTGTGACPAYAGSVNLDNMAWIGRNLNINNFDKSTASAAVAVTAKERNEYVTSYIVFNGDSNGQVGECDSKTLLSQTATKGGTTLYQAVDPAALDTALRDAFKAIAAGSASATAASIVNNSGEAGTNLFQAVFYPSKSFGSDNVTWIGEMQNMWFYLDPYLNSNAVREDTVADKKLDMLQDYIVDITFDTALRKTMASRYNSKKSLIDTIELEDISALWRAGELLQKRDLTSSPRVLKTTTDGATTINFSTVNNSVLRPYLNVATDGDATSIINWVKGVDDLTNPGLRSRTVTYKGTTAPWRLGDIISSTPKVQPGNPLQGYDIDYADTSYKKFWNSTDYKARGMVYVGANDGMLHAFKLGSISKIADVNTPSKVAQITPDTAPPLGQEEWAFIPKNVLPYLRYMAEAGDSHLYSVDTTTRIIDVSTHKPTGCAVTDYWDCERKTTYVGTTKALDLDATSWRTVLLGGMGLGGATHAADVTCTDCVKAPINVDGFKEIGLSSYFALDVTTPVSPSLMWEFASPALGYTLTPPAIIRINGKKGQSGSANDNNPDISKNGRWFAVFASGPTGPINIATHQFYGKSDQNLKLFVVDLKTGALLKTIDTGIEKAFGGRITSNSTLDTDFWDTTSKNYYSHDVMYVGYSNYDTVNTRWDGGVLRLVTNDSINPDNWTFSKVIEGVGPVTASISSLQNRNDKQLWLYFGSGRYFYKDGSGVDDADAERYLYGVKEPCYPNGSGMTALNDLTNACTSSVSAGSLKDQSDSISSILTSSEKGWKIKLWGTNSAYKAERLLTNPSASYNGNVTFTTFMPTADACGYGGQTFVWVVKGMSGAAPAASSLKGKLLLQMSTGAFATVNYSDALTGRKGRRTGTGDSPTDSLTNAGGFTGGTSGDAPPEQRPPKGVPRILQIREK